MENVEKLIAELEADMQENIYGPPIDERDSNIGMLGRIGGLQHAILKIKVAFGLPLTDKLDN